MFLGTPVVPFFPFYMRVSLLKLNIRKRRTLIIKVSLGDLGLERMEVIRAAAKGGFRKFEELG